MQAKLSSATFFLVAMFAGACVDQATAPQPGLDPSAAVIQADTGLGNNVSNPVEFAEGLGLTGTPVTVAGVRDYAATGIRPTAAEPAALAELQASAGPPFFWSQNVADYQGTHFTQKSTNSWQAAWLDGSRMGRRGVRVDWGDNLLSRMWNVNSRIRIEHGLYDDALGAQQGFNMFLLYGKGASEVQGTDGSMGAFAPTVYTVAGRLIIQRIAGPGGAALPGGTAVDMLVADGIGQDGPGWYKAEVNVAGKVIYGYQWVVKNSALPAGMTLDGWWRIIYRVNNTVTVKGAPVNRNVAITALTPADLGGKFVPGMHASGLGTWLDIQISK